MTLQIEAGKYYKTRDGRKVGPVIPTPNDAWPFWCNYELTRTGKIYFRWNGASQDGEDVYDSDLDLIAEWTDTPSTWGELTDAEKGALLLAEYEGGNFTLQYRHDPSDTWGEKHIRDGFGDDVTYRIKPEPVVETVTLSVGDPEGKWINACDPKSFFVSHTITFTTKDGEPDLASITMERINEQS